MGRLEEEREEKLHSGYLYIFVIYEICYIYERIKYMHWVIKGRRIKININKTHTQNIEQNDEGILLFAMAVRVTHNLRKPNFSNSLLFGKVSLCHSGWATVTS